MTIAIKPTASGSTIEQNGSTILTVDSSGNITPSNQLYSKGPAFSAYGSAKQSISHNTVTKINFNTEEFDTNSNFDATTNYRFTPTVAGYYQLNATIGSTPNVTGLVLFVFYKNGSFYHRSSAIPNNNQGPDISGSTLAYMNGSTDYIEVYGYQNSGGALNVGSDAPAYPFTGVLVSV